MNNKLNALIILINYNQNRYTLGCIDSILNSDYNDFNIFIIDNGSDEDNKNNLIINLPRDNRITFKDLKINIGYVGAVNKGLSHAKKLNVDYIITLNNDTYIDRKSISSLIETSKKYNDNAIVSGKVYHFDNKEYLQTIGHKRVDNGNLFDCRPIVKNSFEKDIGQFDEEIDLAMTDDILWCFSKKVLNKVGLYSNYFFAYGEQNDYVIRAVNCGFKIIYTPLSKIWHKGAVTTSGGIKWGKSPKIEYWSTMAVQKLSLLHLSEKEDKVFRLTFIFKLLMKDIFKLITFKISFNILLAHFMAVYHFFFWKKIKYIDNGYNPFNK